MELLMEILHQCVLSLKHSTQVIKLSLYFKHGYLLNRVNSGVFEYETDGLIFTPSKMGVGGNAIGGLLGAYKNHMGTFFQMEASRV